MLESIGGNDGSGKGAHQSGDAVSQLTVWLFTSCYQPRWEDGSRFGTDGLGYGEEDFRAGRAAAQARKAFENVRLAPEAAGATPADVVRLRVYVVNYKAEDGEAITGVWKEFFPAGKPPASTLLGVQSLAVPEFLIEVEATAVVE